jgi:hypothetical protein
MLASNASGCSGTQVFRVLFDVVFGRFCACVRVSSAVCFAKFGLEREPFGQTVGCGTQLSFGMQCTPRQRSRSFRAISRQCLWICSVGQVAARYFEAQAASGQVLKVPIAGE